MKLRLESGQEALALAYDGNLLKVSSPLAFAPGSPIRFTVACEAGERTFEGRVVRSKRVDDQTFEVRMRFVNLRREDRELLLSTLGP
ncbi:MAG: PilZ domain-containing protein [Polyangiales bacterium]